WGSYGGEGDCWMLAEGKKGEDDVSGREFTFFVVIDFSFEDLHLFGGIVAFLVVDVSSSWASSSFIHSWIMVLSPLLVLADDHSAFFLKPAAWIPDAWFCLAISLFSIVSLSVDFAIGRICSLLLGSYCSAADECLVRSLAVIIVIPLNLVLFVCGFWVSVDDCVHVG
ncbi:hypothetical protein Dimus_023252, partial [Dionaea muscipula]